MFNAENDLRNWKAHVASTEHIPSVHEGLYPKKLYKYYTGQIRMHADFFSSNAWCEVVHTV